MQDIVDILREREVSWATIRRLSPFPVKRFG
jgi:hypothetical protein